MIDHDDDAMARLSASDPATGSHPDLHSLRRQVAAKAPASQADDADRVTALTDDLMRGPRIRAPWIAAAAVAALGIGAGGYALGAQNGAPLTEAGGTNTQVRPGSSEEPDEAGGEEKVGLEDAESSVGAESSMGGSAASADASKSSMAYDPGPVRLTAGPGLSTERSTGQVSALVASLDDEAFLAGWAERLGVEGSKVGPDQSFFPGNSLIDVESGQMVSVTHHEAQGPMNFSYEDVFGNPDCATMFEGLDATARTELQNEWDKALGPDIPLPDPSRCTPQQGERPSDEAALTTAQEWLDLTGLEFPDLKLTVSPYQDQSSRSVYVEGTSTGELAGQIFISITVGPEDVISANGSYAELSPLGDYPVISAVEAVERYGQRQFSVEYAVQLPEDSLPFEETSMPAPDQNIPTTPITPGMDIPLLLQDKTVTRADLVQGFLWSPGGVTMEVPAWKLTTADGVHYAVLAVADEAIDWVGWQ